MKRQAIKAGGATRYGRRWTAMCLCLCVLAAGMPAISGCAVPSRRPTPAATVLAAMLSAVGAGWPQGGTYALTAPSASREALSPTLLSALYGEAARRWLTGDDPPVCDVAIFLSHTLHPAELAVFRCSDGEATGAVAAVCRARLDTVARHWDGEDYTAWMTGATVTVKGNYVLVAVADDPTPLLRAAVAAIRDGG